MLFTLSFLADVAGLLGLSIQVIEKIKKKYGDKEGEILGLLLALSEKSKSVKKIHSKYHSLYHGLTEINNYLKDPSNSVKYRSASNINRDTLLEKIGQSSIQDACFNLQNHLKIEIESLKIISDNNVQQKLKDVEKIDVQMYGYINRILSNQGDILKLHEEYVKVFEILKPFVHSSQLSEYDANVIINQRPYYTIHYNNMIHHTDEVLMNYLDLYNRTLEYINSN